MKLSPASKAGMTVGVLLVVVPGGLWISRNAAAASGWGDFERETARLLAESAGRSGSRPVLRGTPKPGRAWEKYHEAIRRLGPQAYDRGIWSVGPDGIDNGGSAADLVIELP